MISAQWADTLRAFITVLLGAGGPIVTWITVRHRNRSDDIPKGRVAEAELTHVLDDTGIAARWQAYADGIEERLNRRIDEQYRQIREAESRNDRLSSLVDVHEAYERALRRHISDRKPPPPPAYPDAIDPACAGWDHGDHVTSQRTREDS